MGNPVVLVTGIAGGIGRGVADVFAASGWTVVGVDRRLPERTTAARYCKEIDLGDTDCGIAAIAYVKEVAGRLDALVNNAAVQLCKRAAETTVAEWDKVMATNVRAANLLAVASQHMLREAHGSIVNIGSVHAVATSEGLAAYATSKGALGALTRALALEMAPEVRVNCVSPGAIDTPMLHAGLKRRGEDEARLLAELANQTPLQRIGKPEDVAEAVLFLADPQRAAFITGQTIFVDGGVLSRLGTE